MDSAIAITLDVEWACDEVLSEVLDLFEEHQVPLTLFCTHAIDTRGHEAALHPNFLRTGTDFREIVEEMGGEGLAADPVGVERMILARLKRLYPSAVGVRSHSLVTSTWLGLLLGEAGIRYDSSYYWPLQAVQPFRRERGLWEIPIFYMDHMDLLDPFSGFSVRDFPLDAPGLKVFDFHPNLIYINAGSVTHYEETRPFYHDADALRRRVNPGRGVRTLLMELLEYAWRGGERLVTLGQYVEGVEQGTSHLGSRARP